MEEKKAVLIHLLTVELGGFLYFCPYLTIGLVNDVLWYKWPPPTATLSHTTWRFGALGAPVHSEWSDVMHRWTEVWIRCFTLPAVISHKSSAEFTVPSTSAASSQSHQRQSVYVAYSSALKWRTSWTLQRDVVENVITEAGIAALWIHLLCYGSVRVLYTNLTFSYVRERQYNRLHLKSSTS